MLSPNTGVFTRQTHTTAASKDSTIEAAAQNSPPAKRFLACVPCRLSKTRCLPSKESDACRACLRSSRACVPPGPPKPRMKSAQRFAELEKKIQTLTNNIDQTKQARQHDMHPEAHTSPNSDGSRSVGCQLGLPDAHNSLDDNPGGVSLTPDLEASLFAHWKDTVYQFCPIPMFTQDINVEHMKTESPLLLLTILTIASTSHHPALSTQLVDKLTQAFGYHIFTRNSQNVDAVMALLLFSHYHFHLDTTTNLTPSKYIHAAFAIIHDLGIREKAKLCSTKVQKSKDDVCILVQEWYAASTTASLFHHDSLVQYSPEIDQYIILLQTGSPGLSKLQTSLIRLQQIIERASILLDWSNHKSESAFDDPTTRYKIAMLQGELDSWEKDLPKNMDYRLKQHSVHTAYLRVHEIAVRCFVRKRSREMQEGRHSVEDGMMGLTPQHYDCLMKCIGSIQAVFDSFLSLEIPIARCLPNSYLLWNITAALLLIKLGHFGEAMTSNHEPMRAEQTLSFKFILSHYLDSVARRIEQLTADGFMPQARPYVSVMRKLKMYYVQKRDSCITAQGQLITSDPPLQTSPPPNLVQDHTTAPTSNRLQSQLQSQHRAPSLVAGTGMGVLYEALPTAQQLTHSETRDPAGLPSGLWYSLDSGHPSYTDADENIVTLDPEAMMQLDAFMWAEENTTWMQALLSQ
ncbi:hypothetical protein GGR57DRAFT_36183 [Xylariaceae sp. FL1272]|nr:hypothetical protein GGR57DRAFT_36183 [Xylariaceae sp. FL1272]